MDLEKVASRVVLAAVLAILVWFAWHGYQKDMAELASLRTYKTSIEARNAVSEAGRASFQVQQQDQAKQAADHQTQRLIIETKTNEVARQDPATADFLAQRIPERLRAADREARLARGLGAGGGAPAAARSAN